VWTTLSKLRAEQRKTVTPAKSPNQLFELYSVPSHAIGKPELVLGKEVGSAKQVVEESNVLVCKINPRINRVWVVGNYSEYPKIASTEWIIFKKTEGLDPRYLCYFMRTDTFRDYLAMNVSGVGGSLMRARAAALDDYPFPVAPLPEQRRIVAKIEELFTRLEAGVAALRRVQAALKRYRAAMLKAACEGRLVPQDPNDEPAEKLLARILAECCARWEANLRAKGKDPKKAKYVEPKSPDTDGLPEVPKGWCWAMVGNLVSDGPTNGLYLPKERYGHGVPILRIDDFQNDSSRSFDQLRLISATAEEIERYSLQENDLVVNRVNSLTHLGKCMVVSSRNLPALFESNMMRIRLSQFIDPKFVEAYLHSTGGRIRLTSNAKWAVNQASINQKDVENTPIPLAPLAEQRRIVAEVERRLSVVQELEHTVAANLARAERLRQAILRRAFEGKLVAQDPNDEPASDLLSRMRKSLSQ
jgi:type I restriction enzyme S subunit